MNDQMPERIRKLKALADDERAPQGERAAARRKLEAALKAAGITEDQIDSEAEIQWCSWALDKTEEDLFLAVLYMITDKIKIKRTRANRVKWHINCFTTSEQKVDVWACFNWYWSYLEADREKLKSQRAKLRAQIKQCEERITISRKAERELVSIMIGKYSIYSQGAIDRMNERMAKAEEVPAPAPTKEKARKQEDNWAVWDAAAQVCTNGEAWTKPTGDLEGSQPFQLT